MIAQIKAILPAAGGFLVGAAMFALWAALIYGPTQYAAGYLDGDRDCKAKVQAATDAERDRQAAANDEARVQQRQRFENLFRSIEEKNDELEVLRQKAERAGSVPTVREDGTCEPLRGISADSMREINRH